MEKHGEKVTYLQVAVPEFDVPNHIYEAIRTYSKSKLREIPTEGLIELRQAISEKVEHKNKVLFNPDKEVIVTVGAMQGISAIMQTFINQGDEVLITQPGFTFDSPIMLAGGTPVYVPLSEEKRFVLEPEELEKRITEHTKMIVVNTPHNPTGHVLTLGELEAIAETAKKHDLLVLSDEVFENFVYDGLKHYSIAFLPGMRERTIIVNSLSKNYAMYDWRVGYLAADEQIMKHVKVVHCWTVSFHSPPVQLAALAALTGPQEWVEKMVKEYEKRRNLAVDMLNKIPGISCIKPEGTIVCFPNVSGFGLPSVKLAEYLVEETKVVTSPGEAWLGEGHLRIALTIPEKEIVTVFEKITEALANLPQKRSLTN
jgi:aspartate/methionine/tyrosine aminotransferase